MQKLPFPQGYCKSQTPNYIFSLLLISSKKPLLIYDIVLKGLFDFDQEFLYLSQNKFKVVFDHPTSSEVGSEHMNIKPLKD